MKANLSLKKTAAIFGVDQNSSPFIKYVKSSGVVEGRPLEPHEVAAFGKAVGYFSRPSKPLCISVFVTKGGVLKTSLCLNLARTAALHGLKVCVVGLDMQADITSTILADGAESEEESLSSALARANDLKGLSDLYAQRVELNDIIIETELPTLHIIPETPELVALDQSLVNRNRREYWLRDHVVDPLKKTYDLILLDCSPNWNRLITNALMASDVLLSPVECRVTNFRNLKIFRGLIKEFQTEMATTFEHWYVATKLTAQRRLSREIYEWYQSHLNTSSESLLSVPIRESLQGEEATAMRLSVPEYLPNSKPAIEMRALMSELQDKLKVCAKKRVLSSEVRHVSRDQ
jgi:chromosome partitioning protein